MPAKKKINLKKSASPRRNPSKSRSKKSVFDSQMGYVVLMAATLALLASFHFAHDRLVPAKPLAHASITDVSLGK
jgi:hypothetical protein